MHQLGLDFAARAISAQQQKLELSQLLEFLASPAVQTGLCDSKGRKLPPGWATALHIGVALGWADRKVRLVASESDQVISYPGSPGYKIVTRCTAEEYRHYRNAMRAQARGMIGRVMRTDRQFFGHAAAGI